MTIHLPGELENRITAAVHSGRFASLDDAMAQAARLLLRDLGNRPLPPAADTDPLLGSMSDHAELMDEIVADAYRRRREETWRESDLE